MLALGQTVELQEYPGCAYQVAGFDDNGNAICQLVSGSGIYPGQIFTGAPDPVGIGRESVPEPQGEGWPAIIADAYAAAEKAYKITLEFITTLGQAQGQADLWYSLSVGDRIPPGYGEGMVSLEMLQDQRRNWLLARDRALENLVQQGQVYGGTMIDTLLALLNYVLAAEKIDRAMIADYRNKLVPLDAALEEANKVSGERLAGVLADYRAKLARFNIDLGKLKLPEIKLPEGAGFGLFAILALGAIAFGFAAGR